MKKRPTLAILVFSTLLVASIAAPAAAQESGEDAEGTSAQEQTSQRKFALNDKKDNSAKTGLKWVDSDGTPEEKSKESESRASGSSSTADRAEAETSTESASSETDSSRSDQSSEATKFEQLAAGGRDATAGDQSVGMESDSAQGRSGTVGTDVQFGEKNIGEIIDLHRNALVRCYRDRVGPQSQKTGTLTLKLVVEKDGTVRTAGVAESSLQAPSVESCMVNKLRSIEYPPTESGQPTTWTIPFRFGQ